MDLVDAVLLALLQVFTEFLPVSSSGHLVIAQRLLGIEGANLTFNVLVHLGTLIAIIFYFLQDLIALFLTAREELNEDVFGPSSRLIVTILLANIPAAVVGIFLKEELEGLFASEVTPCLMFLLTAFILYLTKYIHPGDNGMDMYRIPVTYGLLIGLAQALAIVPGLSRSGLTISTALLLMVHREDAGTFSFLLSIPAIGGAALLKFMDLQQMSRMFSLTYLVGFLVSCIGGLGALKLLMSVIRARRFYVFSYYLIVVGVGGFFLFYYDLWQLLPV